MQMQDQHEISNRLERRFDRLWPICRSISGPGFRASLDILREIVPFEDLAFASGERVLDWTVPDEWTPRAAWLLDPAGRRFVDFAQNNLHLLGYSQPFRGRISLDALREHLYTLPEQPEAIPYLTSYYKPRWGFCLTHREYLGLAPGEYEVCVDTELRPGRLVVGEAVLPGSSDREVLFSSYLCHPSMANNELSGPLVLAHLYERVAAMPARRYTYRFVIGAETIGAIAYLSRRGEHLRRHLDAGFQMTCLGDPGAFTLKTSRRADTLADRAAATALRDRGTFRTERFDPSDGSDERQWCSPGFDLPVASVMRTMYGKYPEYHTSLDDKRCVSFDAMAESIEAYVDIVGVLESNAFWRSTSPYGEPQLSRRDLYGGVGSQKRMPLEDKAIFWALNLADGRHDMIAIAERAGLPFAAVRSACEVLECSGLVVREAGPLPTHAPTPCDHAPELRSS